MHNTFQSIVITNGTKTYAVFTYHCDDINWANGNFTVIGFNAGGTSYENYPLSGTPDASASEDVFEATSVGTSSLEEPDWLLTPTLIVQLDHTSYTALYPNTLTLQQNDLKLPS